MSIGPSKANSHGKGGPGTLRFRVKSDNFTKDQVLDMLKSMK